MLSIQWSILFLSLSLLSACNRSGGGRNENQLSENGATPEAEAISSHEAGRFVASISALPSCDHNQEGKLFYISGSFEFKNCHSNSWEDINVRGPQGDNGLDGSDGGQGPQGLKGETGEAGPAGLQGPMGLPGATGATGPQGPMGLTGPTGSQGPAGSNGATGATGPQGPIGLTGPTGPQGVVGATGATGATGPQGPEGVERRPVRFTRGTVNTTDAIETKDALCVSEFGLNYETAHHLELGFYMSFSHGGYFNTFWQYRMELKPVQTGGVYYQRIARALVTTGLNQEACIYKYASIRVTRSMIISSSSDALKDALCLSEFGSSYVALSKFEFGYHKQIETDGQLVVAGTNSAVGVSLNNSWTGTGTLYLACIKNE